MAVSYDRDGRLVVQGIPRGGEAGPALLLAVYLGELVLHWRGFGRIGGAWA